MDREITFLNADTAEQRLENLKILLAEEKEKPTVLPQYSNNHIHTTFSFSPYSPTAAVWAARRAGLSTAGIMDHDSISGASEFRKAAALAGVGSTCGVEMRISWKDTPFAQRRINNPDQCGVAYMTFHSIRERYFEQTADFLKPYRERRNIRNIRMLANIKEKTGIALDFEKDVLPLSEYRNGGSVTERHLLFALAKKVIPDGSEKEQYKLLGQYKAGLIHDVYIEPTDELLPLTEAIAFAKDVDAILCYSYLGDVTNSPTGDKKAAKFEDEYLDELIAYLPTVGIPAMTYMPSRNTTVQLDRLMNLCEKHHLKQISGEDINSPSQSFICKQLADPKFAHLVDAAWELVEREREG